MRIVVYNALFEPVRIASWNVNGLRACTRKGFLSWLEDAGAQVVGVQEVRATVDQLPESLREPRGWHAFFAPAKRKGYSGVGLFSRTPPDEVETSLGDAAFDDEGRVQLARFGGVLIANVYFPNGSGPNRDHSRVPYKLRFYQRLYERLAPELRAGRQVVVMGDFNTSPYEIDLARPKQNHKTSGFLPEERAELVRWLDSGFVDSFRMFVSAGGHYTWWSQRVGVRARNIGWRLDLALVSPALAARVSDARIHPDVQGSDHCPISLDITA